MDCQAAAGRAHEDWTCRAGGGVCSGRVVVGRTAAAAMPAGHRPAGGWTAEQRWSLKNDWEPNIAADPSSAWLYQMTTQYGGPSVCRPHMDHCILFRSSANRGRTWHKSIVMNRRQCPPAKACRRAAWQNDPVLAVSASGVIYAAWMNQWDVVFAKSAGSRPDCGRVSTISGGRSGHRSPISLGSRCRRMARMCTSRSTGATLTSPLHTITDGNGPSRCGRTRAAGTGSPRRARLRRTGTCTSPRAPSTNAKGTVRLAVILCQRRRLMADHLCRREPATTAVPSQGLPERLLRRADLAGIHRAGTILAAYVAKLRGQGADEAVRHHLGQRRVLEHPSRARGSRHKVGADFPKVAAGPRPGDFAVAWEDDRNGATAWNV